MGKAMERLFNIIWIYQLSIIWCTWRYEEWILMDIKRNVLNVGTWLEIGRVTMNQLHLPHPQGQGYLGNNISNWGVKILFLWKIINRKWKSLSYVQLFVTPWTLARQVSLSTEFCRQEYWNGLTFPSPEDLPNPRIELGSLALHTDYLPSEPLGKP